MWRLKAAAPRALAAATEVEHAAAAAHGLLHEQRVHRVVRAEAVGAREGARVVGVEHVARLQREHGREDLALLHHGVQRGARPVELEQPPEVARPKTGEPRLRLLST
jgi:hypothetical protein